MKTKAAILEKINAPLVMRELDIPELKSGQVLVDIQYSGICQSQLNEWRGRKGPDRFLPHTLGHEGSGTVLETGLNVSKVKNGDNVVITWIKGSGLDVPSCQYRSNGQIVNSGAVSTFMTRAVVSENRLVPVSNIPMDVAALLGCAVPTGCGMVLNELMPEKGRSIAIWGAGGIGLCAVLAASACGCEPIIAVDIREDTLALARKCGATHLLDGRQDPVQEIMEITNGQGTDFGIESAGLISTMQDGFAATRRSGGKFLIAGNAPHGEKMALDPFDLIAGKNIYGSWGGSSDPDKDIPRFTGMYKNGTLNLESLITERLPFDRSTEAFAMLENGHSGRVILEMDGES
jgi:S-(hydroxymethyl)glutathione dehydrogenase / alcohol dehydrogenase